MPPTLLDLIIDVLKNSNAPLLQGEIVELLKKHPHINQCGEWSRVTVPSSAVARCLTNNINKTSSVIGAEGEKASFRRYYYQGTGQSSQKIFKEIDLHPILVKYARAKFGVYCKTIQATKIIQRNDKTRVWANPDIVGIEPILLSWNGFFQRELEKLGMFSTKVLAFYSFELKLDLQPDNLTESYFQTVSNSNWANYSYLVVRDFTQTASFLEQIERLNAGYGVGLIKLNENEPLKSEIIIPARFKENLDIHFMNFLSDNNIDFNSFLQECMSIVSHKKIDENNFDALI